jgi:hypothetical protein
MTDMEEIALTELAMKLVADFSGIGLIKESIEVPNLPLLRYPTSRKP